MAAWVAAFIGQAALVRDGRLFVDGGNHFGRSRSTRYGALWTAPADPRRDGGKLRPLRGATL